MKILVTRGAGFIGSHLVKKLLEEGKEVIVAEELSRGKLENLKELGVDTKKDIKYKQVDLRDYKQYLKITKSIEVVYRLAARVGSIEYLHGSELAELRALQDNLAIDANVFRACLKAKVKKIICVSSVSIYPIDKQQTYSVVISEDDLTYYNPERGYGWAKLLGEIQLKWMNIGSGIARIFNVYGSCKPLEETAHVIPALIKKAILYPKVDLTVWGDGNQERYFLYVSDCIDALIKLEDKAATPPLIVNIGSDKPVNIKTIAEEIVKISGKDIKIKYDPTKPVGPLSRIANIRKAKKILNWKPKIGLREG